MTTLPLKGELHSTPKSERRRGQMYKSRQGRGLKRCGPWQGHSLGLTRWKAGVLEDPGSGYLWAGAVHCLCDSMSSMGCCLGRGDGSTLGADTELCWFGACRL